MAWSNIHDEFTIDDIGARLLANLARGIYNHEAVLREYVQNACDAYALLPVIPEHASIQISAEGEDTIAIHDNGIGMDKKDIKACKKIAVSPKADLDGMTGFRGIGIWAGFQACDNLEIVTTKAGNRYRYRLHIDFADILKHVDEDINIKQLLDGRFRIDEDEAPKDDHYTRVKLIGLQGDYRRLTQRQELERIASFNLPCKIDPQFKYVDQINKFLDGLEGYQQYSILVEGGEVFKQFPEDLDPPEFVPLTKDGEEFGRIWYCSGSRSLPTRSFQYRNFRLRIRNFAVGRIGIYDDEDGSGYGLVNVLKLNSRTHLNWHVGEIHITHTEVRPDTPRSGLELDFIARKAIEAIRSFYQDRIVDSRALAEFNTCKAQLDQAEEILSSDGSPDIDRAKSLYAALRAQEDKIRDRSRTDKVKKRLRELLARREHRNTLKRQIAGLAEVISKAGTPVPIAPASRPTASPKPQSPAKPPEPAPSIRTQSATPTDLDYEELLSDVFAAVENKVGVEEELFSEICEAIRDVFKTRGLIDA